MVSDCYIRPARDVFIAVNIMLYDPYVGLLNCVDIFPYGQTPSLPRQQHAVVEHAMVPDKDPPPATNLAMQHETTPSPTRLKNRLTSASRNAC